jgi:hypothetical protein
VRSPVRAHHTQSAALPIRPMQPPKIESPYGVFAFPDPEAWPASVIGWFERVTGCPGLHDLFIFDYGESSAMYLEDALTAAATLPLAPGEWFAEYGYPAVIFSSSKIGQHRRTLENEGYRVSVMTPEDAIEPSEGPDVTCISRARKMGAGRHQRWA